MKPFSIPSSKPRPGTSGGSPSQDNSYMSTRAFRPQNNREEEVPLHHCHGHKRPRPPPKAMAMSAAAFLMMGLAVALSIGVVEQQASPLTALVSWWPNRATASPFSNLLKTKQRQPNTSLPTERSDQAARRQRKRRKRRRREKERQLEDNNEDNQNDENNDENNNEDEQENNENDDNKNNEEEDNNNNNEDQDDNNDDEDNEQNENQNENDGNDDGQEAEEEQNDEEDNNNQQQQNFDDDYYRADDDDEFQYDARDDYYLQDDEFEDEEEYFETEAPVYIDDDFYAFQEDPGPPRLFPLTSRDVAAFLLASMGLTLGASGGIGGGGIVVPVYILVAGLTPKIAIPLGSVTVLGGSLASTSINSRRRHPLADRPIIDWDLVLVTEPLVLLGALIGTLLHRVLSEKFLIVLLVLLLSVSAHSTLAKAKRMYDAESRYIQKLRAVHNAEAAHHHVHLPMTPIPEEPPRRNFPLPTVVKPSSNGGHFEGSGDIYIPPPGSPNNTNQTGITLPASPTFPSSPTFAQFALKTEDEDSLSNMALENLNDTTTIGNDTSFGEDGDDDLKIKNTRSEASTPRQMGAEERQQILILNPDFITLRSGLLEEEKFTPRSKIIALCLMFFTLMFLNIMIGGGAFPSPWGIGCGSVAFWVVHVIMVAFLVASAWAAQTYLVNRHEMKEIVRFDYVHGDIKWDARSAIIYPALFICAGTFAGMFGIGGGMITVPLMLAMGVHPAVVSATSSAMILFTSFASAISYLVFGLILYDYAIVFFVIGFFASLFGNKVMRQARQAKSANGRNFERNSYIAFCIGGVILVSALLMTIDYVFRVYAFDDMDLPEGLCEGYRI